MLYRRCTASFEAELQEPEKPPWEQSL